MSDEEENYDDFMMSDDDGVVEMEDELGSEDYEAVGSKFSTRNEESLEDLYELGVYHEEEQDWAKAGFTLRRILDITKSDSSEDSLYWRHRSLLQLLHLWASRMHYNDLPPVEEVMPVCKELVKRFGVQDDEGIWSEMFATPRGFLFDDEFEPLALARIELELKCIEPLMVNRTMQMRENVLQIWRNRLRSEKIGENRIAFLESHCFEDTRDDVELDSLRVEIVSVVLQCYIHEFMSTGYITSVAGFSQFLNQIESHANRSLAVSQTLGIMMQLPIAQSIEQIIQETTNTKRLQTLFWSSLRQLEEIGGPSKFNSRLEEFILCGFIFCSMIMYRENGKVNPFDLEQVKIVREMRMVQILQGCYASFVELNLPELGASVTKLPITVLKLLDVLVKRIHQVAQVAKLWESLAPLFSCISIQDLQKELQVGTVPVTRDYVLRVLMKSIMKDRAAVYYKLDLKQDLVYFGNENKVPLSLCAKQSLSLAELERSNDIGLWHSTRKLKHTKTNAFFQDLQRQRVSEFEADSFQPRSGKDHLVHELTLQAARVWSR